MTEQAQIEQTPDDDTSAPVLSNWEFVDRIPTTAEVVSLLGSLPSVYAVDTVDFADYVQALPQRKKVKHPETGQTRYFQCYSLYMAVAGRVKMLERICEKNNWRATFEPERKTPTGAAGILQWEPKLVYREYLVIDALIRAEIDLAKEQRQRVDVVPPVVVPLGRKPGMADVPAKGGEGAAGTNPFSKVETSARGRAIGAWGIGVLPGSGVASVEEILASREPARQPGSDQPAAADEGPAKTPDEMIQEIMQLGEQLRGLVNEDEDWIVRQYGTYLAERLGVKDVYDEQTGVIDWEKPKPGQLVVMRNALQKRVQKTIAEGGT